MELLYRYVSDHGLDGFAGLCQRKLLSSHKRSGGVARSAPPTELEWQANRKKARMALEARFPDGEAPRYQSANCHQLSSC